MNQSNQRVRVTLLDGPRLRNYLHFQRDPIDFLTSVREVADAVQLYPSKGQTTYVVNSPEMVREILVVKENKFHKGRPSRILEMTVQDGLLTTEGSRHEQQKRMMLPAFHKQRIVGYADIVGQYAEKLGEEWKSSIGRVRSISQEMTMLTLQIITQTMFHKDFGEQAKRLGDAVEVALAFTAKRLFAPIQIPRFVPTKWNRLHKHAVRELNEAMYELIKEARRQKAQGIEQTHLLGMLLESCDEQTGQPLTDDDIYNQMVTILIAGHETSANSLSWAWYLLSQNPEVEAKFHRELDEVLGGRTPTFADLATLTYTQQIVQETLRLYPAAWTIMREALDEVELCGHLFPRRSIMVISPYAIHRQPSFFPEPDRFMPERFGAEASKSIPRFAYFPFSGGSRSCIGSNFAMMELVLTLATLGQTYRLRLADDHLPIEPVPGVSLRMKHPLQMCVQKR